HAAAYLMRALGLPTRVSVGYAVEAENLGGGSSLLIKSANAHAWAELYLRGVGWIPIEVTPTQTDIEPKPFQEQDLQQLLGEMARREAPTDRTPPSGVRIMDFLKMAWTAMPWVLLAMLALAYAIKIWRSAAPWIDRRRPRLAYRAALDRLSAAGWIRAYGESRERFAARVQGEVPSFVPLTAGLSGYVLGSVEPPEVLAGAPLPTLAQAVGREVRRSVPAWRWLAGVLNPVSWWWSR
ncbi:MAG: transglutaminase domain-containing protein, partial [Myxococcota bacterium]